MIGTLNRLYQQLHNKSLPHEDQSIPRSQKSCWIFQGNPDYFDIRGMLQSLREINWSVRKHSGEIHEGDQVFIWQSGPDAGILGICTVLSEPTMLPPLPEEQPFNKNPTKFTDTELRVRLHVDRVLPIPVTREEIKQNPDLESLSVIRASQGTNFPVTAAQAKLLLQLTTREEPTIVPQPRFTDETFSEETGFSLDLIREWKARLLRKKHIVLQGPPGTGKTFIAERLARLLVSETQGFWDLVQFHPSYAYEDFMQGIRPEVVEGKLAFQLSPGRFLQFCQEASKRGASQPCVLIVDEINRANLSRVFGELMYLLEYRQKAIPLSTSGKPFKVPDNIYIIGTMNTADRSIALVDHALRRRFSFIFIGPEYDVLRGHLEKDHLPTDSLIKTLRNINTAINDRNYEVGISFFLADKGKLKETLPIIWTGEIEPYLEEYFFDQPDKVDEFRWNKLSKGMLSDWIS
ncbi:MAG: AAA family ATPase [Nitrospirota bacterium]